MELCMWSQIRSSHASLPMPLRSIFHPRHSFDTLPLSLSQSPSYITAINILAPLLVALFISSPVLSESDNSSNMSSVCCAEKHHSHIYAGGGGKKSLREIEIPPRKLFSRRAKLSDTNPNHVFADVSDKTIAEDAFLHKFFPCNTGGDDDDGDDDDPYSSDDFRMYEFKVRRCMRSRSHDWTDCPFAHPGEKARRRDPRRYHYSGNVCTDFRRGGCRRGDACEFAHGVFECWLHPARYRTQACKDGKNCKRKVCFFAHTPRQLRVLPLHNDQTQNQISSSSPSLSPSSVSVSRKYTNPSNHCCVFCHSSIASSPTSTLMGLSHLSPPLSPPFSPPLSPVNTRSGDGSGGASFSPFSRFNNEFDSIALNQLFPRGLSHKNALMSELVSSLEAMDLGGGAASISPSLENGNGNMPPWLDIPSGCAPPQLLQTAASSGRIGRSNNGFVDEAINNNNINEWSCPDLGWVDDLIM